MKKVIRKFFSAWEFEKEEKWLNEMAAKGLVLSSVGFCRYEFEECTPGEYNVRLEMLENMPSDVESENYIKFIEETGAEHIGSFMKWVYFRKKTSQGPFELYSDNASKMKHLSRIIMLLCPIGLLNLFAGVQNIFMFFHSISDLRNGNLIGIINLILAAMCLYGCIRLYLKRKKLKKESDIFE